MPTKEEENLFAELIQEIELNDQEKQFIVEYFETELENESLSAFSTLLIKNIIKKLN